MAAIEYAGRPISSGKGWKAYRIGRRFLKAKPRPYPAPLTVSAYRDPITGQFAKRPSGEAIKGGSWPAAPAAADVRVVRRVLEHEDGEREVLGVRVKVQSARAARLRGELRAAELREFERGLADDLLNELNPKAREHWELEQMHAAHNSSKAKRGAVSKKRNAEARAEDERRKSGPVFEWSKGITLDAAQLTELLEVVKAEPGPVRLSLAKYEGEAPRLEIRRGGLLAARIIPGN